MLVDPKIDFAYNCEILSIAGRCNEKFIGSGWFSMCFRRS